MYKIHQNKLSSQRNHTIIPHDIAMEKLNLLTQTILYLATYGGQ